MCPGRCRGWDTREDEKDKSSAKERLEREGSDGYKLRLG